MIITTETVLATRPCSDYRPEHIRAIVGDGLDPADPATLEVVLALPEEDAGWILSKLLTTADAVVWAQACADRARGYAAAAARCATTDYATSAEATEASRYASAAAAYVAHHAAHHAAESASASARYAAAAAAYVAHYAAHYDVEQRLACQHALALLANRC